MRSSRFISVSSFRSASRASLAVRAMLGMGSLLFGGAVSYGANIDVTANSSDPIALTEYTAFGVADAGPFTLGGVISGNYGIEKRGVGVLNLTGNNTFTGGLSIAEGTVTVYADAGGATSANYTPLGTGTVSIAEGAKLVWGIASSNTSGDAVALTNTITGAGTLRIERRSEHGNLNYGLLSKLDDFTGVLELGNNARLEMNGSNAEFEKISAVKVEDGSEFWCESGEIKNSFVLNGYGAGAGGDGYERGAIRINVSTVFSGTMTLESDSLIGLADAINSRFTNDLILNGNTLYIANTVSKGGSITMTGNVTEGTINNRNRFFATHESGTSTLQLKFAAVGSDQTIAADIQQNNLSTAMVFAPEEGLTTTVTGVISGNGGVVKDGAGTLVFAGLNTFSGGLTINEGTVRMQDDGTYLSTDVTEKKYSLGTGAITINENGTLIWHNQFNSDNTLQNPILGNGKLVLEADHARSQNKNDYVSDLSGFTGTLELSRHARLHANTLGGASRVIVNDGTAFWGYGGTFDADFIISGDGNQAGGDNPRGAMIVNGVNTFNGSITATGDSLIGLRDGGTYYLNGVLETNGYRIRFDQTHQKGGGYNFNGGVASSGDTLGTLYFAKRTETNNYYVNFGTATAAESAAVQTIAANIDYRNPSGRLTFQPGENRTLEITGELSGDQGFVKTGAGALIIQGNAPISGAAEVTGGTMTVGSAANASDENLASSTTGFTSLTVSNGAVVNLNTANNSLETLNVVSGTVNLNHKFRRVDNTSYAGVKYNAAITVGSEAGDSAVLKLTKKGVGDHGGTMTIYDGGELIIAGVDCSIGNNHGITFIGGGKISSENGGYFNFRGNGAQALRVQGENARASISSQITLYDSGLGSVDVQEADGSLTISGNVYNGTAESLGFRKTGAGTLYLEGENKYRELQIQEGTVCFRGDGKLVEQNRGNTYYGVNVSIADGAKLVLENAANFTSANTPSAEYPSTFSIADEGTLIVNYDGWRLTDVIEAALTGGTLGGNGRIVGNIDTAGLTIAPGDSSISTLTLDGNLKLTAGAICLEIGENGSSDMLRITGGVDLQESDIFILPRSSDVSLEFGDEFKVLTATGLTDSVLKNINFADSFQFTYENGRLSAYVKDGALYVAALDGNSVPEPTAWIMLGIGGVFLMRRLRRNER